MKFIVISIFPEIFSSFCSFGIISKAIKSKKISIDVINPRSFSDQYKKNIDDHPFGGGAGMVMLYEPLAKSINQAKKILNKSAKVVYLSPQGKLFNQKWSASFSKQKEIILLCGRYRGIDQRVIDHHVDEQISVGDYIVNGGEVPAMAFMESVSRLIPGVIGNLNSINEESFVDGLLDYPNYTRPQHLNNHNDSVPDVLTSGDHGAIKRWRREEQLKRTFYLRRDLINYAALTEKDKLYLNSLEEKN